MPRRRKRIPDSVKVQALLMIMGFDPGEPIHWNHRPALGLRAYDEETGKYDPDELDPRYLEPLRAERHGVVTNGTPATSAGGDIHAIAKTKRLSKAQEEFRLRITAKASGEKRARSAWPKGRKISSRPFQRRSQPGAST